MLKRFFLLCSGADSDIVNSCSNGEQNKYAGIGATVFFTAVMAFIACSYALYTVFDNPYIAIAFGIVWAFLIFNLDRFIVSTIKKRDNFLDEFIQASPRIVLAIIIAIVISKPLEIKIFEKEINTVLLKEKNEMAIANKNQVANYFKTDVDKNKAEMDSLKSGIAKKEKEVAGLYQSYITEAEGSVGTTKIGKGPIYKEKRGNAQKSISHCPKRPPRSCRCGYSKRRVVQKGPLPRLSHQCRHAFLQPGAQGPWRADPQGSSTVVSCEATLHLHRRWRSSQQCLERVAYVSRYVGLPLYQYANGIGCLSRQRSQVPGHVGYARHGRSQQRDAKLRCVAGRGCTV